jgi:biopolymer transport protein TolR
MGASASERRKSEMEEEELQLNLNPMMDMFAVLIPALLMMSTVVEVAILNVAAPSIAPPTDTPPPPKDDEIPLNLTVTVTDSGYMITASGQPVNSDGRTPSIPVIERAVSCARYRGTKPPPRNRNADNAPCPEGKEIVQQSFWVFDTAALAAKVLEIKNAHPDERRVVIQPAPDIEYEAIVDVMDAVRDFQQGAEEIPMFDEVIMGGGAQL